MKSRIHRFPDDQTKSRGIRRRPRSFGPLKKSPFSVPET